MDRDIMENKNADEKDASHASDITGNSKSMGENVEKYDTYTLENLGIKLNFPEEPEKQVGSEEGDVAGCADSSNDISVDNKISGMTVNSCHIKNRKIKLTVAMIVIAATVSVSGFLIFRYNTDPKRELIREMGNLSEETASFESPLVTKLTDEDYIKMFGGMTHSDISLNVSNTGSWPVTVGIDGTVIRNGGDGSVSADTKLSISNTDILKMDLYADNKEICASLPGVSNDYFAISPQHLGKQYNDSVLSALTGEMSNDFSVRMYTTDDLTGEKADYAGIIAGMKISDVSKLESKTSTHEADVKANANIDTKVYTVTFGDESVNKIESASSRIIKRISYLSETGSLLYGEDGGFQYETVTFQKPYEDVRIISNGGKITEIIFQNLLFADKKGDTLKIPELTVEFTYADDDGNLNADGGLGEVTVSGQSTVAADGAVVSGYSAAGDAPDIQFKWSENVRHKNDKDGSSDFTAKERFTYVTGGITTNVEVADDEFSEEGRAVTGISFNKGNESASLDLDGIFDMGSADKLKVKINEIEYMIDTEEVFKIRGSADISKASEEERPVKMEGYSGNRIDPGRMTSDEIQSWIKKTAEGVKGSEEWWLADDALQEIMVRLGFSEGIMATEPENAK